MEFPVELTPRAARILERAAQVAREAGADDFIGVEHIFLAIIDDAHGIPALVLQRLGVAGRLRNELLAVLESEGYHTGSARMSNVVTYEGKLVGYRVTAEDGQPIVVNERGEPVDDKDANRRPQPIGFDEEGNPVWAY